MNATNKQWVYTDYQVNDQEMGGILNKNNCHRLMGSKNKQR